MEPAFSNCAACLVVDGSQEQKKKRRSEHSNLRFRYIGLDLTQWSNQDVLND